MGKKTVFLQTLLPFAKFLLYLWIALTGFPYIYVYGLHAYVARGAAAALFFAFCSVVEKLAAKNRYLRKSPWTESAAALLPAEAFGFLLFAQYHLTAALIAAGLFFAAASWYYAALLDKSGVRAVRGARATSPLLRSRCRSKTAAVGFAAAVILLAPLSVIGGAEEYFSGRISATDWAKLEAQLDQTADRSKSDALEAYEDTVIKLRFWSDLNDKAKLELIRQIAVIEETSLGIDKTVPIITTTVKTDESTFAWYSDSDREIRINVSHLCSDDRDVNLNTIFHEVFHAYQHDTIRRIDFDSPEVQTGHYYADARAWHDNAENYISADSDYLGYRNQPLERDARAYAAQRLAEYKAFLEEKK